MRAQITGIGTYLPPHRLSNADLASEFPEWSAAEIFKKTGIDQRRIATSESTGDLAVLAAEDLLQRTGIARDQVDFLLVCTQTPDHLLPTTACLIQERLGLPSTLGALDINLGCSGYVYGLALADGLIGSGVAKNIVFITADTYTKLLHPSDKQSRCLFGDGAAATLLTASEHSTMSGFVFGTDGTGAKHLCMKGAPHLLQSSEKECLKMNGPAIFSFAISQVPKSCRACAAAAGIELADIDYFVFHQANAFMLEALRSLLKIPVEKFVVAMHDCGNTVSASIPVALRSALNSGTIKSPCTVMLVGFGVGLSWAAVIVTLPLTVH